MNFEVVAWNIRTSEWLSDLSFLASRNGPILSRVQVLSINVCLSIESHDKLLDRALGNIVNVSPYTVLALHFDRLRNWPNVRGIIRNYDAGMDFVLLIFRKRWNSNESWTEYQMSWSTFLVISRLNWGDSVICWSSILIVALGFGSIFILLEFWGLFGSFGGFSVAFRSLRSLRNFIIGGLRDLGDFRDFGDWRDLGDLRDFGDFADLRDLEI